MRSRSGALGLQSHHPLAVATLFSESFLPHALHRAPELLAVSSFWPTAFMCWDSETGRAVTGAAHELPFWVVVKEQAPKTGCYDASSVELVAALHQLGHVPSSMRGI